MATCPVTGEMVDKTISEGTGSGPNAQQRKQIGAKRRAKTKQILINAGYKLFGRGVTTHVRLDEICKAANISRGTFYNHYASVDAYVSELSGVLTLEFDRAVNAVFPQLGSPGEFSAAALRYYMHAARQKPEWGWALINTAKGPLGFGPQIFDRARRVIEMGVASGELNVGCVDVGRDILLGSGFMGMQIVLSGEPRADYPEANTYCVLLALGATPEHAKKLANAHLPKLTPGPTNEAYILPVPYVDLEA